MKFSPEKQQVKAYAKNSFFDWISNGTLPFILISYYYEIFDPAKAPLVSARQAEVEPEELKAEVVLEAKAPEVEQEVESVDVTEDIAQADEPNEAVVEPEVVTAPEVVSDIEGETEKSETDANTETDQFAPRNDPSRLSVNEKV